MNTTLKAVGTGLKGGANHLGWGFTLLFGSHSLSPRERATRTMLLVFFMFFLWNGSPFHIAGAFGWAESHLVWPWAAWPAGSSWWTKTSLALSAYPLYQSVGIAIGVPLLLAILLRVVMKIPFMTGLLFNVLLAVAAFAMLTNFPWNSMGELFSVANIPFAILQLLWVGAVGWLATELMRIWGLAMKDLNADIGQIILRTVLRTVLVEIVLVLGIIWLRASQGQPPMSSELAYQILAWSWQLPLGYFIGTGMNWLIEQRERAGLISTKEQKSDHDISGDLDGDGVPDVAVVVHDHNN